MKKITTQEVSKILKRQFNLKDWLPLSTEFLTVEPDQIREWLTKYRDPQKLYIKGVWECEDIARWFVNKIRYDLARQVDYPLAKHALGGALGTMFRGQKMKHYCNIFITKSKDIWLADAHSEEMWKATDKDKVFFVEM